MIQIRKTMAVILGLFATAILLLGVTGMIASILTRAQDPHHGGALLFVSASFVAFLGALALWGSYRIFSTPFQLSSATRRDNDEQP